MKKDPHIKKELDDLAPNLAKLSKEKAGFNPPAEYFASLTDQIIQQAQENPKNHLQI